MRGPLPDCGRRGHDVGHAAVEARLEGLAHLLAAHVGAVCDPPAGELGVEPADTLRRVVQARPHLILAHSPRCRPHCGCKRIENGGRSKAPTGKYRTPIRPRRQRAEDLARRGHRPVEPAQLHPLVGRVDVVVVGAEARQDGGDAARRERGGDGDRAARAHRQRPRPGRPLDRVEPRLEHRDGRDPSGPATPAATSRCRGSPWRGRRPAASARAAPTSHRRPGPGRAAPRPTRAPAARCSSCAGWGRPRRRSGS